MLLYVVDVAISLTALTANTATHNGLVATALMATES
jgi:hypothetical protein